MLILSVFIRNICFYLFITFHHLGLIPLGSKHSIRLCIVFCPSYTFAPVTDMATREYGESFPLDWLITIFFVTYVIFSFPSSNLVEKRGLRFGVLFGMQLIVAQLI